MTATITDYTEAINRQTQLVSDWAEFRRSFSNEAPPRDTPRTWGFEIETPEADELYSKLTFGELDTMEFCQDSSIEGYESGEECECECEWCQYHSCNCDDCETVGSDDPSHDCGSSDCFQEGTEYQEVKTLGGGVTSTHPEALTALIGAGLESVRITDRCGLHLNIGSRDLTPLAVSRIMTAYRLGAWLFDEIAGRQSEQYASKIQHHHEDNARQGYPSAKMTAVNSGHHFANIDNNPLTARLEFRQHKGTNNPAQIRAWAWLLCELVEFGKSDRPIYWLSKANTLDEFRKALI